jgi:hypothetical protein
VLSFTGLFSIALSLSLFFTLNLLWLFRFARLALPPITNLDTQDPLKQVPRFSFSSYCSSAPIYIENFGRWNHRAELSRAAKVSNRFTLLANV